MAAPKHRASMDRGSDDDENPSREHLEELSCGKNTMRYQTAAGLTQRASADLTGISGDFCMPLSYTADPRDQERTIPNAALPQSGLVHVSESIQRIYAPLDRVNGAKLDDGDDDKANDNGVFESPGDEFSDDEAAVDSLPAEKQLTLRFDHMDVWVPATFKQAGPLEKLKSAAVKKLFANSKAAAAATAHTAAARRQVLFGISGKVLPGEVLALMGPSGSGKTTLLSSIGGRVPQFVETAGAITVNGQRLTKAVRRQIGFVLQDDVLYESLTVWETLLYAALLRLPRTMTPEAKKDRVEEVLASLGLGKSRNTIIGGFMRRGISGGERKRVSIGHELLINPAVLMLDEPTSGLDSTTALHLLSLLRRLANENRAVLTTIHQPSSRLYQKLDKLMLLSEGHVMYFGSAHRVTDWFAHFGFHLGVGINTADFIMDAAMGEVRSGRLTGRPAVLALQRTFERWYAAHPDGFREADDVSVMPEALLLEDGEGEKGKVEGGEMTVVVEQADAKVEGEVGTGIVWRREGAKYPDQVGVLLARSLKVRRFEALTGTNLIQMVAVALVTGLLWWQRGRKNTLAAANDILGLLFFEMLFPSFRSLFSSLFTFPNEYRMLLKERPSGMYKLSAYYFARILADLPIELIFPSLFTIIIYWFGGLRADAGSFFANLTALLLIVLNAQSWGLLLGGLFMDPKTAQAVTTVVMLSFLLVSGFYVRDVPVWIGWIKYLSFLYWGYDLLIKIEFQNRSFKDCTTSPCTIIRDMKSALRLPVDPNQSVWPEVVVLFGMLLALRVVTYYVLRRKTRGTTM